MDSYCAECKLEFDLIKLHRNLVHLNKTEKFCKLCGLLFSKSSQYRRHKEKHNLENCEKIIKCHLCLKTFKDSNRLSIHLEKHSCLHIFKCSSCTKTFALRSNYKHHNIYVHGDTIPSSENNEDESNITDDTISTVTDDFATKQAENVVNISTDTVDSDRGTSYCSICDFNFPQLKLHNAIFHRKKSQLICEICGKIFSSVRRYSKHVSSHAELSINCHVCAKRDFHNLSVFLKHLERHNNLHVFYCTCCSRSFTLEVSLMKHMRRKHGDRCCDSLNGSKTDENSTIDNSCMSSVNVKDKLSAKLELNGENDCDSIKSSILNKVQHESLTCRSISDETMDDYRKSGSSKRKRSSLEGIDSHGNSKKSKRSSCEVENEAGSLVMDSLKLNSTWKSGFLKTYKEDLINDEELSVFTDSAIDLDVDRTCFVCGDVCENVSKHYIIEHNDRSLACGKCGKIFDRPIKLYHHAMVHADNYPWKCNKCSAKFVELKLFRRHVEVVHYRKDQFRCTDCGQSFTSQSTYDGHFRLHYDQLKYKCNFCPKVYVYKRFLIAHTVISDCKLCDISFPCRTLYYEHFDSVHKKEAMFDCPHCNHVATSEAKLKSHKTSKHFDLTVTDLNYCNFCPKVCNSKHNLRRHIKNNHKVT